MKVLSKIAIGIVMAVSLTATVASHSVAQQSNRLTVYVGFQEDHAVEAMRQFTRDTGIDVSMVRMSAGEILARIRAERSNPQASVWYGGPADTFVAAVQEDLLHPYESPNAAAIDPQFKDADNYWTGIYVGALGFASNRDFLERNGLDAPQTWEDLLNPAFRNEIIMAHPASSGTAYAALYTTLQVFGGEEEGFEYLAALHPQVQQYTTSGSAPGRMVGMREAGVGILFAHDIIKFQEEGFTSLELTIPEDGTGYETGAVAIVNNAPNMDLAQQFVDWALTPGAQEVGQRTGSYQNLTLPDANEPERAVRLSEINTIDYDPAVAGSQRSRLIDRWNNEVNR